MTNVSPDQYSRNSPVPEYRALTKFRREPDWHSKRGTSRVLGAAPSRNAKS